MRHELESDDMVGETLAEMVQSPLSVSPRFVILATDSVGEDKAGVLTLDFPRASSLEDRCHFMSNLGAEAATFKPYFDHLVELHYLQRKTCDLRTMGYGSSETVIIMNILDVATDKMETRVLLPLAQTANEVGFRVIVLSTATLGIEPSLIYVLVQIFVRSYIDHAPKVRSN